ncbi:DNA repair protein RadC [Xanthomonas campestris pv. raphani]|nr:DNA repair protein RadC [Xanthomonas campestris]MCC5087072.1 DNA repair protein RadC [Xanthomonas campestris]MCC8485780.1 DNA repair protein RadC [Xanthomonas campestris]MDM7868215.1 DNA repair protein RadC [Xanthomonas campestris pv. campestris]MDO0843883.1 DNA repair protein RadC [Xanthomonas campestris pv. campestris]MEA0706906.1 DNA repair protein RadC [Xanthomonas campestris pv. campestris]
MLTPGCGRAGRFACRFPRGAQRAGGDKPMKRTQDLKAQYQLQMDEEGILLAAATILEQRLRRQGQIHSPEQAGSYLVARCAHLPHEVFGVLFLDTQHQVLTTEHLFTGTIDGCDVHPRVVARRALELNAAAVILFHNHPSGNPEPSEADRKVTERLKQALGLLDIRLLDHLVIGGRQHTSLAARGWA